MTHRYSPLIVAAALVLGFVGADRARADLASDIKAVLADKTLHKAEVGVQILKLGASPDGDASIFKSNAETPLIPASNLKLVTTSAALDALGADFKFRTLLLKHNDDLVLIGDGDPTLGDAELLRKSGWTSTTLFKNWAEQLKKNGIASFARVVVDDSVFDEQFLHPRWPADQIQKRYVAEVAGVNLNANCMDFYIRVTAPGEVVKYIADPPTQYAPVVNTCLTGGDNAIWLSRLAGSNNIVLKGHTPYSTDVPVSVTIHDPAMFAATVLQETFAAGGITFASAKPARNRSLRAQLLKTPLDQDPSWQVLAIHETPLSTALARANKDSVNVYAESMCKRIGAAATNEPGSWKNGTAANAAFLTKIGISPAEFKFDDGCGLSKENTISANALTQILAHNWHTKDVKDAFFTSLSIAGKDGTLEMRFQGTDLRGRVFGKSGFVNGVRTLSGYLKAKDDNWYAFSILMNNLADTVTGKNLQEFIVKAVDVHSRQAATAAVAQ